MVTDSLLSRDDSKKRKRSVDLSVSTDEFLDTFRRRLEDTEGVRVPRGRVIEECCRAMLSLDEFSALLLLPSVDNALLDARHREAGCSDAERLHKRRDGLTVDGLESMRGILRVLSGQRIGDDCAGGAHD